MRLSELGELGLLAELERRGLAERIEHDAAAFADGVVVTQDALVEGVHFRLDSISWRDLGWRAAAVNLSDLAASGADPDGLVVTLAAPPETRVDDVLELYSGLTEAGVPGIGGGTPPPHPPPPPPPPPRPAPPPPARRGGRTAR